MTTTGNDDIEALHYKAACVLGLIMMKPTRQQEKIMNSENKSVAYKVPVVEKLLSIPKDFRLELSDTTEEGKAAGTTYVPIGIIAREAADKIRDLEAELEICKQKLQDQTAIDGDSIKLSRRILTNLGFSIEPSAEPGADARVDRIAGMIAPYLNIECD